MFILIFIIFISILRHFQIVTLHPFFAIGVVLFMILLGFGWSRLMLLCPSLSCNRRPVASLYGVGAQFVAPGSDCLVCLFLFSFCSFAFSLLFIYILYTSLIFVCFSLFLALPSHSFFFFGGLSSQTNQFCQVPIGE